MTPRGYFLPKAGRTCCSVQEMKDMYRASDLKGGTVTETVSCLIHMYSPFTSLATPKSGRRSLPPGIRMFSSVLLGTRYGHEMPAIRPVSYTGPFCGAFERAFQRREKIFFPSFLFDFWIGDMKGRLSASLVPLEGTVGTEMKHAGGQQQDGSKLVS